MFRDVYKFPIKYVDDLEGMDEYINAPGYGGIDKAGNHQQVCFAILFEKNTPGSHQWKYSVHYNQTGNPEFRDIYGGDRN